MINTQNITQDLKFEMALNIQAVSTDTLINGNAIDLSEVRGEGSRIGFTIATGTLTTGGIAIQDIQFSKVSDFTSDVVVIGNQHLQHFSKSDANNVNDALVQTLITTANTIKKIGLHIPVSNYRYCRVRCVSSNNANLTFSVGAHLGYGEVPVNQ